MTCMCRVGRCGLCESMCRRCGCACDGVDPTVAQSRKRGRQTGSTNKKRRFDDSVAPPELLGENARPAALAAAIAIRATDTASAVMVNDMNTSSQRMKSTAPIASCADMISVFN